MRLLVLFVLLLGCIVRMSRGHNITKILAQHPEFSTFNHYLTTTHLASDINRRLTITVLAVDNAGMSALLAKNLPLQTVKHVLALHVLVDYYGTKKLHQLTGGSSLSSSMFQATGAAPGTTGFVNISDHRAGKVTFAAQDAGDSSPAAFVKSIKEIPYNISVVQISSILTSPEAEAPSPAPAPVNLTSVMAKKGCKEFSGLLIANPDVEKTFESSVDGGLTVFCPGDKAISAFMPKYKNLTASGKASLLLYHGVAVYYSMQMLKSNNEKVNTLASDGTVGNFKYTVQDDGEVVTLKTRVNTASITATLVDQDQLAVYSIDKVLEPTELFKVADAPAPAPAPAAKAPATKGHKAGHKADSPSAAAGPDEAPADQKVADDNAGDQIGGGRTWVAAAVAAAVAAVAVMV